MNWSILLLPYHFLWTLAFLFSLPLILFSKDARLRKRMGLTILPAPFLKDTVWIHALSVGEVMSALPLIRALKKEYPDQDLAFTVTTRQGMQVAQAALGAEVQFLDFMPFDFWWAIHRMVRFLRPRLFILVESDLWPGLIFHLKKTGAQSLLFNGRISPRTFRAYYHCRFLLRFFLGLFERLLMQTQLDRERLLQIGIPADKVLNNGNIKFDRTWQTPDEKNIQLQKKQLGLETHARIWVAGSTHPGEEEAVLNAFTNLRRSYPDLFLILAPRRIERADEIYQMILARGLKGQLRTSFTPGAAGYDILVLNTLGELEKIYALAEITFVGGSLVPIGGHNLLEPAGFAKPVMFGPYTHNFEIMAQTLIQTGGGRRVQNTDELFQVAQALLADPSFCTDIGTKAQNFVKDNSGALVRTLTLIKTLL